jgi:hypothetical protein
MMLATLVDTNALWRVIVYALVAGVGITAVFSFAIVGVVRFDDIRRGVRSGSAAAYAALALLATLGIIAVVIEAIVIMTKK